MPMLNLQLTKSTPFCSLIFSKKNQTERKPVTPRYTDKRRAVGPRGGHHAQRFAKWGPIAGTGQVAIAAGHQVQEEFLRRLKTSL